MELPGRERSLTISSAIWIQCTNVTDRDGRTDTGQQQRLHLCMASCGNKHTKSTAVCNYIIWWDNQMSWNDQLWNFGPNHTRTRAHTHNVLMAIFPGEPGLAGCPLILLIHLFLDCASFWDRPKLSMFLNTIPPGLFWGVLCQIPSTSHVIQHLTQSLSFFCSTCPNHLNSQRK